MSGVLTLLQVISDCLLVSLKSFTKKNEMETLNSFQTNVTHLSFSTQCIDLRFFLVGLSFCNLFFARFPSLQVGKLFKEFQLIKNKTSDGRS
jgi:hypothetical protein